MSRAVWSWVFTAGIVGVVACVAVWCVVWLAAWAIGAAKCRWEW